MHERLPESEVRIVAQRPMMTDHQEDELHRPCDECGDDVSLVEWDEDAYDERGRYRPVPVMVVECDQGHRERRR
jgi:hypothetical protein